MFQLLFFLGWGREVGATGGDGVGLEAGILGSGSWSTGPCDEWEIGRNAETMTLNSKLIPRKDCGMMAEQSCHHTTHS